MRSVKCSMLMLFALYAMSLRAQMMPNPYGASVTVENAKKAAAAALAEAQKNHWNMAVQRRRYRRQSRLLRENGQHAVRQRRSGHRQSAFFGAL